MKKLRAVNSLLSSNLGILIVAGVLTVAMATLGLARSSARTPNAADDGASGKVLGMAFDGHQVANLDQSIKYYEVLDFHLTGKTDWKVDKVANELGGTKGAESRTAIMTTQSSVSDKPFNLILREYKGIDRKDWSGLSSSALGAGHLDLTVMDDCNPIMNKYKAMNMLRVPEMGFPSRPSPDGKRAFVFLQDPDGWFVELFAMPLPVPGAPPAPAKVSNSTATQANIDRFGKQAGFNHIGLNIIDPAKALAFYQGVLGGDYPAWSPAPAGGGAAPRMTMLNGWFPQATTEGHVRLELLGSPQNADKQPPGQHFADINVNYVGFQVTDIDAVYAAAKAAGATTVSEGGIVKVKDGRAVVMQDPDVGGFVELWQAAK